MKKKLLALILASALTLGLFAGCAEQKPTPSTTNPTAPVPTVDTAPSAPQPAIDKLVVGTTSVIETATAGEYAYDMLSSGTSQMPLVWQDTDGVYHPLLADFETTDGQTWTFTIREGMCWDDGEPVTAEDILFTLQQADAAGSANLIDQTAEDGKVTEAKYSGYVLSEDKSSISLTLAKPNVRELSNMTSFRLTPKHILENNPAPSEADLRVGCGPYRFASFDKNAGAITFEVNPHYPETPNVAKIVYQTFGSEDVMYTALTQGDIDLCWNYSAGVSSTYQSILDAAETVKMIGVPATNAPAVLVFNNENGLFANENLRMAVAYALDYNAFKLYFGSPYAQIPNRGFVPSTTVGYTDTDPLETDLAKAAAYMSAAGYTKEEAFYQNADGQTASFTLTYNAGKPAHAGFAELVKTNLELFGIQVNLEGLDSASYNAKTCNKFSENNITHEAAIFGFTAAGMGMINGLATIYVDGTHPVQGGAQVFDPAFQTIRDQMSAAKTLDAYYEAARQMQQYYAVHLPLIALYWDSMMLAHSAKLENITVDAVFGLNNVNNWLHITK